MTLKVWAIGTFDEEGVKDMIGRDGVFLLSDRNPVEMRAVGALMNEPVKVLANTAPICLHTAKQHSTLDECARMLAKTSAQRGRDGMAYMLEVARLQQVIEAICVLADRCEAEDPELDAILKAGRRALAETPANIIVAPPEMQAEIAADLAGSPTSSEAGEKP